MLIAESYEPEEKDKSMSRKVIFSFFKPEYLAKIWNLGGFSDCRLWMNKLVMLL